MDDCAKQIRMLTILQKEYVMDEADYTKTSKLLQQRQTKCGRLQYNIGKAIAVYYLCKFLIATKQIIYPVYSS
jgi:hypothetical protein